MDPDVTLALGLSALAESKSSYPAEWGESYGASARLDAREFAQNLFDWLCKGGAYPKDIDGTYTLLLEFGFDPTPTLMSVDVITELAEYYATHDAEGNALRRCRECSTLEGLSHKMDCATGRGYGVWRNDPWH